MINLQISENLPTQALPVSLPDQVWFTQVASQAVKFANLEQEAELTIVLTDDEQLRELNRQYRHLDSPTDVLSFPLGDIDPESGNVYLGDIVISLPRALEQAAAQDHPLQDELRLLVVHGVLHLLGYDHGDEDEQARMWAAQDEIFNRLPKN
jgi:probable rRNA maturation factor